MQWQVQAAVAGASSSGCTDSPFRCEWEKRWFRAPAFKMRKACFVLSLQVHKWRLVVPVVQLFVGCSLVGRSVVRWLFVGSASCSFVRA
jgi:hypothetical protein